MSLANRRQVDDTGALVRELAPADKSGIGLTVLASRLNVPTDRIEALVRRHPDYFVRVGNESRYRLNQFGTLKGSAEQILVDIERSYDRSKHLQVMSVILAVVATLVGVTSFLLSNK